MFSSRVLSAVLVVLALAFTFAPNGEAEAREPEGSRFFVVEWRLEWNETVAGVIDDDGAIRIPLELILKGRTQPPGQGIGEDFEMTIPDAGPYLEVLRTCGIQRLSGTATTTPASGKVVGVRLTSLNCRAILK